MKLKEHMLMILTGLVVGVVAIVLMLNGNPGNMGFCLACFLRDTAGGLKLHTAAVVQYVRPEIIGLVLGSFLISLLTKEFRVRGGSSPMLRFVIGFFVMVGALVFLGCPLRMVLRMGAGDLNAWIGLIGFIAGIYVATLFLKRGFSLKRSQELPLLEGLAFPLVQLLLLIALLAAPALLAFSEKGPGSMHAPLWMALLIALVVGAMAQKSRLCMAGSFRDIFLFKDFHLFYGSLAILVGSAAMALLFNKFNFGMQAQPIAHDEVIWNILGLFVVGFGSVLIGGCPLRQTILAGTGNTDSVVALLGMIVGSAFCHNFALASGPSVIKEGVRTGGTTPAGRIALIAGLLVLFAIAYLNSKRQKVQE